MNNADVWESFPRATWDAIRGADEDLWHERLEESGILVVVDEHGTEVNAIAAPWVVHGGLVNSAMEMPMLRAIVTERFPALFEAFNRELSELEHRG